MSAEARFRRRLYALAAAILLGTAAVAARLVFLQVIDAEAYRLRARDQHEGNLRIEGPRGTIWDRNGRELAVSIETRSIYVHPKKLPPADKERIISGVSAALGRPAYELRALIDNPKNRNFVFLQRRLTPREVSAVEALRIPSIGWMSDTRRFYPRGSLAAHLLGFVDIDGKGQAGLERSFDSAVRGEPTLMISLMDARQKPLMMRAVTSGRAGRDLVLTIDDYIQHLADTELDAAMEETGAQKGTVIVLNPRTGEILALANRPTFDPNQPGASSSEQRENTAVSYGYEPGSTFKVITASVAIEEGRAHPGDLFDCGMGSITIYGRRIGDHHSYGALTLAQIISKSSNVGIIRVGQRIPERTFVDYVKKFGFGRQTGVTLPSEAAGLLQVPGGRTWSGLSQPMMSMGQSIFVTPLQMLTAVATIAGGGERRAPRIVRSIVAADGTEEEPEVAPPVRVISERTAEALVRMMEGVVTEGTGKSAAIPGYRVAGKTGTAQKVVGGVYSHSAHIASFAGFAPAGRPALTAIVVLDEPVGKYYGGDVAAPTFARIVGPALTYLRVPPDQPLAPLGLPSPALQARAENGAGPQPRPEKAAIRKKPAPKDEDEAPPRPFPAPWPPKSAAAPGTVPDLYGWDLRDALTALARSGCAARTAGSGFVVSQAPPPGSTISSGDVCSLVLASTPPGGADDGQGL